MILCIDIGNTNVQCAFGTKDSFVKAEYPTDKLNHPDDFTAFLLSKYSHDFFNKCEGCVISSVVPLKKDIIESALNKIKCFSVDRNDNKLLGIDFTEYKGLLGEDRIVCTSAVASKYQTPFILIDFGTATTINVVNKENIYLGGVITLGVQTGVTALSEKTAQLPDIDNTSKIKLIGQETKECLASGAIYGTVFMVEGYVNRILSELESDTNPIIIITGGCAKLIITYMNIKFFYEPDLIIQGLFNIYNKKYKEDL